MGGDFYEVFDAGPASIALIGDVTGHSVTAATVTALMRYGARFASRLEPQPAAILHRLDEELRRLSSQMLCTALCARLGPGELVLSSAGHPPALRVDADGRVTEAPVPGPLLGAFEDATWNEETVAVGPGDLVLLYTDGVTETAGERRAVRAAKAACAARPSRGIEPGGGTRGARRGARRVPGLRQR